MSSKQVFRPPIMQRGHGYIGQPPLSSAIGVPLQQMWAYMSQYNQRGNVFTFSGPPDDTMNCDWTGTGTFYIPMYGAQKYDSTDTTRQLHGAFLPWAMYPNYSGGVYNNDVKIEWKDGTGGSFTEIWDYDQKYPEDLTDVDYEQRSPTRTPFLLPQSDFYSDFQWTPPADGQWYLCACKFSYIMPAAFSIWDGPDITVDDDQIQVNIKDVAPGKLIRAYASDSDNHPSIGHLNRLVGYPATEADDTLATTTNRMLLNTGHPVGIWRNTPSYINIGGADASYKVCPQNIEEATSGNATCRPCCVVTTSGATGEYIGYVKFSSATAGDTWILEITSDQTAKMYEHTDGTTSSLDVDLDWDYISVEICAPSAGGEITLHSFALVQETALQ